MKMLMMFNRKQMCLSEACFSSGGKLRLFSSYVYIAVKVFDSEGEETTAGALGEIFVKYVFYSQRYVLCVLTSMYFVLG